MMMNKRFLFITPLTPKRLLTPLRSLLFDQFLNSLWEQRYSQWEAILIGEENKTEHNINYLAFTAESKELKLAYAKEYILSLKEKPDYIIRMDDDDLINPFVLERASTMQFDCYADQYHTFFDLTTGKISMQKRSWLANTVIHKYEHAMNGMGEGDIPLLLCDHSKDWMQYYKNKKIIFSKKKSPIYLRILSPTTVTSGIHGMTKNAQEMYNDFKFNVTKLTTIGNIDFRQYKSYLKEFGKWRYRLLPDFIDSQQHLENTWKHFQGNNTTDNLLTKIKKEWDLLVG